MSAKEDRLKVFYRILSVLDRWLFLKRRKRVKDVFHQISVKWRERQRVNRE